FIETLTFNGGYEDTYAKVREAVPLLRSLAVAGLDDLAGSPALEGIEELTIRSGFPKLREIEVLAASPHISKLRRLGFVYANPSQREVFSFVALPLQLDELSMGFYGEPFYGRLMLEHLAKTPQRRMLKTLRIRWLRRLGIIRELGNALPNLETLHLENADLTAEDLHAIVRAFPRLVSLDIGDNEARVARLDLARLLAGAPALDVLAVELVDVDADRLGGADGELTGECLGEEAHHLHVRVAGAFCERVPAPVIARHRNGDRAAVEPAQRAQHRGAQVRVRRHR